MQQLLAKIRQSNPSDKCALAAEAHAQLAQALENHQPLLDSTSAQTLNLAAFDYALDEFEEVLTELELLLVGLTSAEAKKIKQTLDQDYDDSIQLMKFYELLNPDGRTYTADYAEFADLKFMLPTKPEILSRLTPQNLKLYQQMEKDGLQPKLQITPIAFQIRTLGKKLDAKKAGQMNTGNTYVWEDIKDGELQYAPTSIKASSDGKQIQISGGISKSQWIKANGGFLVDIVSMKPELDADPKIQKVEDSVATRYLYAFLLALKGHSVVGVTTNYNAIQAEKYAAKFKENGLTSMSYESYLLAQMSAIKAGKPLEATSWSLLLDSNLKNSQHLAGALWDVVSVGLFRDDAGSQDVGLRLRASVNVS